VKFIDPESATPIDPSEAEGLIPKGITTQTELNELEERNIAEAIRWAFGRKRKNWLPIKYIRDLHMKMFGNVWNWAGKFRTTNKNIGKDKAQIQNGLKILCDDVQYWIEHKTYNMNEIAVRFHHRLVSIHPFVNGNGRHARMMADVLLFQNGIKRLSWGAGKIGEEGAVRKQYIFALKKADQGDIEELIKFSI
jgi:Fic-DOC domain mobile mystery protein B